MACLAAAGSESMFSNFHDSLDFSNLSSTHISKLDFKSSLFNAVVLCYWDNIIGPRLSHVWLGSEEKCKEDAVKYVVSHTLNGELTRQAPKNAVDSKLFIIKERGLVFSSFIFSGLSKGAGETLYSLSLLLPFPELKKYLPFQELVDIRMKLLVAKLRVLQKKDLLTSISNFSKYLPDLINTMSSLQLCGLPSNLSVWDSAFAPGNSAFFNPSFLEKAIISHLETFGCTVVVAKSAKVVNLMINTLALFLSADERCQSLYITDDKTAEYDSDLFIQGILTDNGSFELPLNKIWTSRFPATVIHVDKEEVLQSCSFGEHCLARHQCLNLELECLWNDNGDSPLYPALSSFHVKHESKTISEMLSDIQLLPPQESIRLAYIENFKRLLRRKAMALIKYIEDLSRHGYERMDSSGLRETRRQLHLTKDGDFLVVLAVAEKMRPNFYMCAMGEINQNGTEALFRNVLGCL